MTSTPKKRKVVREDRQQKRARTNSNIKKYISCDSTYMLTAIDRVGKALREQMW